MSTATTLIAISCLEPDDLKSVALAFDDAWPEIDGQFPRPDAKESCPNSLGRSILKVASDEPLNVEELGYWALARRG